MNFEFDDVDDEELDFVQPREKIPVSLHITAINKHNENEISPKQNLSNDDAIDDIIDQMKKEFIDLYPKNYMGGLELDGCSCEFSLNKVLEILDKYKKE